MKSCFWLLFLKMRRTIVFALGQLTKTAIWKLMSLVASVNPLYHFRNFQKSDFPDVFNQLATTNYDPILGIVCFLFPSICPLIRASLWFEKSLNFLINSRKLSIFYRSFSNWSQALPWVYQNSNLSKPLMLQNVYAMEMNKKTNEVTLKNAKVIFLTVKCLLFRLVWFPTTTKLKRKKWVC